MLGTVFLRKLRLNTSILIWLDISNKKHELNLENACSIDWANAVDLGNGWKDVTIMIRESINRVFGFSFWMSFFHVDDIRAIDISEG